ncbi:helix-turn-helix domain-containing protein [Roseovarius sp. Pro17]|uniref:TetR/AcrR family transcriptional regulator n=1 Tax=Roseovarius sp. Pro17 TaxID=3108175 RepID=UPI002D78AFF8|nr:helix-turn-helix domain-containing protein [Roseovarius sp. Pro17]
MTKASQTRRALIEKTALRLFADRGYAEVSVRDISQACGIGESALYRHMTSKEELAIRVFREAYLRFGSRMLEAAQGTGPLKAKLSAYLRVMLEGFDEDAVLMRFLLISQHETLAKAISSEDITPVLIIHDALSIAASAGEVDLPDVDMATALVMGAALQPMTFMLYGRLPSPAISHHPAILEGLTRLLGLN